jgi:hypothetical protein
MLGRLILTKEMELNCGKSVGIGLAQASNTGQCRGPWVTDQLRALFVMAATMALLPSV